MSNFRTSALSNKHQESIKEEDDRLTVDSMIPKEFMTRAEKVANLSPVNYPIKLASTRFNFGLDADERDLIN
jgi:hypothetical protein